jgi:hypothetical protein
MLKSQDWAPEICTLLGVGTPSNMFIKKLQDVPFIVIVTTNEAVSYRKPASTGKWRDSCGIQDKGKTNALYNEHRLTA